MNRITTLMLCLALTGLPCMLAQAAATPTAKVNPGHRVPEQMIRCTQQDNAAASQQPCKVRQVHDAIHLGSDVSRQEFECVLSGNCGATERSRISG
jgi:hypothetical protein